MAKLCAVIFYESYLQHWPSFIRDLLQVFCCFSGQTNLSCDLKNVDFVLRVLLCMDEEIMHGMDNSSCHKEHSTLIKDSMRNGDVVLLGKFWYSILPLHQSLDSLDILSSTLKCISLYVSWMDFSLLFRPEFFEFANVAIKSSCCIKEIVECLQEFILKGMNFQEKLNVFQSLDSSIQYLIEVNKNEEELQDILTKLINSAGLELVHLFSQAKLANTTSSFETIFNFLFKYLQYSMLFLEPSHQLSLVENLFPFMQELLDLVKKIDASVSIMLASNFEMFFKLIIFKMKSPKHLLLESYSEEDLDEEEFSEHRHYLKVLFDSVLRIYPQFLVSTAFQYFSTSLNRINSMDICELDMLLYLISICFGDRGYSATLKEDITEPFKSFLVTLLNSHHISMLNCNL